MIKRKTVFEQVPLAIAKKVAAEELKRKEARPENSAGTRKSSGHTTAIIVVSAGASL
ncbi:MAG: hypothetical protein WAN14_00010 [Candidatus Acidiferrales bacterium]